MEYDQVISPTQATLTFVPCESLDDDPPQLVNLEVMDLSTDNHREVMPLSPYNLQIWNM